jgi:hypothetical protein
MDSGQVRVTGGPAAAYGHRAHGSSQGHPRAASRSVSRMSATHGEGQNSICLSTDRAVPPALWQVLALV